MMRKSIIFDKKTPNVFYCPLSKPKGQFQIHLLNNNCKIYYKIVIVIFKYTNIVEINIFIFVFIQDSISYMFTHDH